MYVLAGIGEYLFDRPVLLTILIGVGTVAFTVGLWNLTDWVLEQQKKIWQEQYRRKQIEEMRRRQQYNDDYYRR